MITVKIFRTAGRITGFSVSGHSGMAARGYDIVCAGVSSLTQSALLGIARHLRREIDYRADSGVLDMTLKDAPDDKTEAILATMCIGLEEIARLNPKAVTIQAIAR